jgi:hypothetical protein
MAAGGSPAFRSIHFSSDSRTAPNLDEILAHVSPHDDVWFATGSQIADWYYEHHHPLIEPLLREAGFFEESRQ